MKRYTEIGILVLISILLTTVTVFSMGCSQQANLNGNDSLDQKDLDENIGPGEDKVDDKVSNGGLDDDLSGLSFEEADSGDQIKAVYGEMIFIRLEENPTTGYRWNLSYTEGLEPVRDEYIQHEQDIEMVGVGGVHEWSFKVVSYEDQSISAVYKRPWEETTGKEDSFLLDIKVTQAPADDSSQNAGNTGDYVYDEAPVEDIEIMIMESFPLQASVHVTGYLPDGCTQLDEENIDVEKNGNTINVTLKTIRPKDEVCTLAIVPYEINIPLDIYGYEKGVYTVDVNGVTEEFELTVDNIIE